MDALYYGGFTTANRGSIVVCNQQRIITMYTQPHLCPGQWQHPDGGTQHHTPDTDQ
jgi:hypothetical protein